MANKPNQWIPLFLSSDWPLMIKPKSGILCNCYKYILSINEAARIPNQTQLHTRLLTVLQILLSLSNSVSSFKKNTSSSSRIFCCQQENRFFVQTIDSIAWGKPDSFFVGYFTRGERLYNICVRSFWEIAVDREIKKLHLFSCISLRFGSISSDPKTHLHFKWVE